MVEVFASERARWAPRLVELAAAHRSWNETELTLALTEEMAASGAALLRPIFDREHRRKGWQSIQVDPANYRDPARMVEQAVRFAALAPNLQVKFPVTAAGILGIEEAVGRGINITATVSFTLAQAIAAAEAVERGLDRFAASGADPASIAPVVVLMIGRLDDWMKAIVERDGLSIDPAALDWAGIATFKRAYAVFRERGYRSRLLAAAYRHHLHWTELVGGEASLTIPRKWQVRFNASGIDPQPRIDLPVDPAIVAELCGGIADFRRAYEPDGLTPDEFDTYGATVRTLRQFIKASHDLTAAVRDVVLRNPDVHPA
jgi:transaldolase